MTKPCTWCTTAVCKFWGTLRNGNNANVSGVRLAGCQYKLQRVSSTNTTLSTTLVTNPEAGIQVSLVSTGLKDSDTEGWEKSYGNKKVVIFM
jgi:hypothetical protein